PLGAFAFAGACSVALVCLLAWELSETVREDSVVASVTATRAMNRAAGMMPAEPMAGDRLRERVGRRPQGRVAGRAARTTATEGKPGEPRYGAPKKEPAGVGGGRGRARGDAPVQDMDMWGQQARLKQQRAFNMAGIPGGLPDRGRGMLHFEADNKARKEAKD